MSRFGWKGGGEKLRETKGVITALYYEIYSDISCEKRNLYPIKGKKRIRKKYILFLIVTTVCM